MASATVEEAEFIRIFQQNGAAETAKILNMSVRAVYKRRKGLERAMGRVIVSPNNKAVLNYNPSYPQRLGLEVDTGIVVIASDAHYWPERISAAHRALVRFCKEYQPKAVIMNGDVFDGASISRHPPIGWEQSPTVEEELGAAGERLAEIFDAAPNAEKVWTLGNHDARFETRLATVAPQYAGVKGVHLKDHFAEWKPCWSIWINDEVVVKHRFKGGIHATHNNTLWAGKTMVTGHLHSLKVTPFSDYNGTRWGVDTGTLAGIDPMGPQFADYLEDNPVNWRSGFAVLTFHHGRLLWPELVHVISATEVEFRGKVHEV